MEDFKYDQGQGYRIYRQVIHIDVCQNIFNQVTIELCCFVFGDYAPALISTYGLEATKFISDPIARKDLGIPDTVIRRHGNPRDSKVLKKSGKTSLYISPYIRDGVRRNIDIYTILSQFYGTPRLAFTSGLDYFIYKPNGSEESLPILDCKITEPLEPQTSANNPFHYTCIVCLSSVDNGSDDDLGGSVSILEGFDVNFDDIKSIIGPHGRYPIEKQKKHLTVSLLENLNLKGINDELQKLHNQRLTGSEFLEFKPLRWVKIPMRPGDVLIMDCRLPYKTARNKYESPSVFVPVSLRPLDDKWYGSASHKNLVSAVTEGKAGDWKKRTFKGCNLEEYTWRNTQNLLPNSTLAYCTRTSEFNLHDQRIFGLQRY